MAALGKRALLAARPGALRSVSVVVPFRALTIMSACGERRALTLTLPLPEMSALTSG